MRNGERNGWKKYEITNKKQESQDRTARVPPRQENKVSLYLHCRDSLQPWTGWGAEARNHDLFVHRQGFSSVSRLVYHYYICNAPSPPACAGGKKSRVLSMHACARSAGQYPPFPLAKGKELDLLVCLS